MEVIVGAAVIALGIVLAAVLYGRTRPGAHVAPVPPAASPSTAPPEEPSAAAATASALQAALAERGELLERRERAIANAEAEIELERESLSGQRAEAERRLEQLAGMSGA